jgi:hypothetical protein
MSSIPCSEIANYDISLINGSVSHCCKFKEIIFHRAQFAALGHKYFSDNSETVRARTDLANGVRTTRCKDCWDNEDKGILSWRQFKNAQDSKDAICINLQLSSLCNQACFYCAPQLSSSIAKYPNWIDYNTAAIKKNGVIDHDVKITIQHINEFIKTIPKNINLLELGLTGGEPFLLDNFEYDLVELAKTFLDKSPNNRVIITPSTNTNSKPEKVLKFYENIKKLNVGNRLQVTIISSIENLEERAEYVRDGLKWDNFVENFKIHHSLADNIYARMTLNPFSIVKISDFVKYFAQYNKLRFSYNYVAQPYFRVNILDRQFLSEITKLEDFVTEKAIGDRFQTHFYKELAGMLLDDKKNAVIFKQAITNLDSIKNKNWRTVFPEYISWFDNI